MDPRHRTLRRIRIGDTAAAAGIFDLLMGSEVGPAAGLHRQRRHRARPRPDRHLRPPPTGPGHGHGRRYRRGPAAGSVGSLRRGSVRFCSPGWAALGAERGRRILIKDWPSTEGPPVAKNLLLHGAALADGPDRSCRTSVSVLVAGGEVAGIFDGEVPRGSLGFRRGDRRQRGHDRAGVRGLPQPSDPPGRRAVDRPRRRPDARADEGRGAERCRAGRAGVRWVRDVGSPRRADARDGRERALALGPRDRWRDRPGFPYISAAGHLADQDRQPARRAGDRGRPTPTRCWPPRSASWTTAPTWSSCTWTARTLAWPRGQPTRYAGRRRSARPRRDRGRARDSGLANCKLAADVRGGHAGARIHARRRHRPAAGRRTASPGLHAVRAAVLAGLRPTTTTVERFTGDGVKPDR